MDIPKMHNTRLTPDNTIPIISPDSPPHSPLKPYKMDDRMDVDVDTNPQIHPTGLTPVNTSPTDTSPDSQSPPYSPSELRNRMDINVDDNLEKEAVTPVTTDSVIAAKDPHLMQTTKEKKLPLSFNATSLNEREGRGSLKRRLQVDGKKEDDNKRRCITVCDTSTKKNGVGASTLASRKLNQQVNHGTFKLSSAKWKNFKEKISFLDKNASFPDPHGAPRSVRHSKCGRIVQMKEPYNVANFESHLKTCRSNKTAGMPTLESLFNKLPKTTPTKSATLPLPSPEPCPGLTETDHPEIPKYLKRSPACGGGAPSLDTISNQLWKKQFSKLSPAHKQKVWSSQRAQLRWYNDFKFVRVFSSSCTKISNISKPQTPCHQCSALLDDKGFRQALSVPIPAPENVKFMPKHWINTKAIELWGDIHGIRPLIEAYDKV